MKKKDIVFIIGIILFFAPFFLFKELYTGYTAFNKSHGMIMAFIKFAILATLGEVIGLRIRVGAYNAPNFGIIPRALVWGVLGLTIQMSFTIFSTGTPIFLEYLGLKGAVAALKSNFSLLKLIDAFSISVVMNVIYAPVMMTLHKITDTHIMANGGTVSGLFKPIRFTEILTNLNWNVQWNFVFTKTIPFFWIPAHTITFLLKPELRILFAALLGIALGVILAIANQMSKEQK